MCSRSPGAACSQRCTGSRGARSLSLDSSARASTRLTVHADTPTVLAIRASSWLRWRNPTVNKALPASMARGDIAGLEDASVSPASPPAR